MANFYAKYPASNPSSVSVATVQGEGTAGAAVGGILTVQGDPSGTPIPVSGSISATNPSVSATGAAVPASATYMGVKSGANIIGLALGQGLMAASVPVAIASDQSAVPVSGTVTANQGTANATPWTVTGTGTAGTAAAGVVTIQGIASMTAVKVDGSGVTGPVNVTQFGSNNVVTGTGAGGNGIPRVTVSSDSTVGLVAGSAIIGNVRIDQTTPGTTNGVQVNAALPAGTNKIGALTTVDTVTAVTTVSTVSSVTNVAAQATWTTSAAVFQAEGSIAFGSMTNAYQTIFTPSAATKILQMRNNTNAAISVSFDAGTTLNYVLDAGDAVSIDLLMNGLVMSTTAIQVRYTVGAPTSGSFRVNGAH